MPLRQGLADAEELFALALEESDAETLEEVSVELAQQASTLDKLEFRRMFSGPMDSADCYVDIQAGSGGTEAQDWAEMLLRMYLRWAERRGFSTELIELSAGEVAGIKGATFALRGDYAFGWMRTETGIHRLVRKSPFDSGARRHTSFVSVFVSPEVDDDIEIEINPADVRTDTYRSSGAGGQHVNTTDSAVQIQHKPSGLIVRCADGRSQQQNKIQAMTVLRSRLLERKIAEEHAKYAAQRKAQVGTGERNERIRTYNFPQNRVTDHRIELTLYNLPALMEGDMGSVIEPLMQDDLSSKLKEMDL